MTHHSDSDQQPVKGENHAGSNAPVRPESRRSIRPSMALFLIAVIVAGSGAAAWAFSRPSERRIEFVIPTPGPITVHVTGAVTSPGVYTLPPGARAGDAVEAAGGLSGDSAINLAASLHDGQQLVVTALPVATATSDVEQVATTTGPAGKLDLNTATLAELEQLPGINPTRAAAIINFREYKGPILYADDLTAIDGIGPDTVDAIRPLVIQQ